MEQLRWDFKWLRKIDECIVPPTSKSEEITKNGELAAQQPLEMYCLIIYMDSMLLGPFYCHLTKKRNSKKKKKRELQETRKFHCGAQQCCRLNQWQWLGKLRFLLTFNSPKHPCFTAPWAIAFLNLSLERQELWSLSIEEKGMLFPCHLLVAPPSSLPWSTADCPPYSLPLPHFASS